MKIPPLNGLKAFEAAARLGGFIPAAEELNVTRGAISAQVKGLEDHLGTPLFRRHSRGVELNEAGKTLLPHLTDAFARIAEGVERATDTPADLRIICPPATSMRWLMPNLGDFRTRHPDIRIQVTTDYYGREGYDGTRYNLAFSIEHWQGRAENVVVQPLAPLIITPGCTPEIAARLTTPTDLTGENLLHETHDRADWTTWLKTFPAPGVDPTVGDTFHNLDMAVQAAKLGAGIVMADLLLCRAELESGQLVLPFPKLACDTPHGRFALLGNRDSWDDPPIAAFRSWAADVAARDSEAINAFRI